MKSYGSRIADFLTLRGYGPVAVLVASFVLLGLLEVVGIASIMPFMQLVSDPTVIKENAALQAVYDGFGFESDRSFLIAVGLGVLILLTFANAMNVVVLWITQSFVWKSSHILATELLKTYMDQPYEFFLARNSSELGNKLLSEVDEVARSALLPIVQLVAKGFVTLSILGLLFFVDVLLAVIVSAALGLFYSVVYLKSRYYLGRIGKRRFAANRDRFRSAGEAFGMVKVIKATGTEAFFVRRFARASKIFTGVQPKQRVIAQAPIHVVRSVAFGGILLIVLYLLAVEGDLKGAIPMLSLYALAGYKLMPNLQTLFRSVSTLRFQRPALDSMHHDLFGNALDSPSDTDAEETQERLDLKREIRLDHVSFSYAGFDDKVLNEISLTLPAGAKIGIVGPTGSGKSTLIDILVGLLPPTEGRLLVDETEVSSRNAREWRRSIGYVPQDVVLYDDSVSRNIVFAAKDEDVDLNRVRRAARLANIDDFIENELAEGYDSAVGERGGRLSGGQRQRIGLARALYRNPAVLVLDEATSALDGMTEEAVMNAIDELDREVTIVMVAHRLATVRHCDTIYLMDRGRVVAHGSYSDLIESNQVFREMARVAG